MATLFCTRSACLRTFNTTPRSLLAPAAAAYTTSSHPLKQTAAPQHKATRPAVTAQLSRHTSVSTTRRASTSTTASQTIPDHVLTWDRFFDLRRKRRWINLGCSVVTAVVAVGMVTPVLAQQDFDSWGAQISGLDPVVVLGISTFAVAAGGWLCGPSFGNLMFALWAGRRGWNRGIAEKEKSFYARIKRYRADAAASSPQNPVPDYYGEKIGSVKDYRRWLKDQKAFNLKKNKNMI